MGGHNRAPGPRGASPPARGDRKGRGGAGLVSSTTFGVPRRLRLCTPLPVASPRIRGFPCTQLPSPQPHGTPLFFLGTAAGLEAEVAHRPESAKTLPGRRGGACPGGRGLRDLPEPRLKAAGSRERTRVRRGEPSPEVSALLRARPARAAPPQGTGRAPEWRSGVSSPPGAPRAVLSSSSSSPCTALSARGVPSFGVGDGEHVDTLGPAGWTQGNPTLRSDWHLRLGTVLSDFVVFTLSPPPGKGQVASLPRVEEGDGDLLQARGHP